MDFEVLTLGIILILGGIGIYYLARKKGTPNLMLWSLFPVLHGVHEIIEFIIDNSASSLVILERFEQVFSIGSSLVLLAACIEYTGGFNRPYGKLTSLLSSLFIAYFLFFTSNYIFNIINDFQFAFGIFVTDFFRFFYGFVLVIISMICLITSYLILKNRENKGLITLDQKLTNTVIIASIMLFIFAIFEGFDSQNAVFVTLRGISAILFLLVPVYAILSNEFGLMNLIVTQDDGNFIFGYNFKDRTSSNDPNFENEKLENYVLTSGFISAINTFSSNESDIGSLHSINTERGNFIIVKSKGIIYSLLTLTFNETLKNSLSSFGREFTELFHNDLNAITTKSDIIETNIKKYF